MIKEITLSFHMTDGNAVHLSLEDAIAGDGIDFLIDALNGARKAMPPKPNTDQMTIETPASEN